MSFILLVVIVVMLGGFLVAQSVSSTAWRTVQSNHGRGRAWPRWTPADRHR